jgi:hypothetical protein
MKEKNNIKKNCVLCSNNRYNKYKICKECLKIKDFIHKYGIFAILHFIETYNFKLPLAPSY